MKDKKHIDQLFKDRFKNFEATPSPEVWNKIQAQLKEEKEERKVIPLWWKVAGVAALLALLLTIGNTVFDPFGSEDPSIVTEDPSEHVEDSSKDPNTISNESKTVIASEATEEKTENRNATDASEEQDDLNTTRTIKDKIVNSTKVAETTLASDNKKKQPNKAELSNDELRKKANKGIASDKRIATVSEAKKNELEKDPLIDTAKEVVTETKTGVAENKSTDSENLGTSTTTGDTNKEDVTQDKEKPSIYDAIASSQEKEEKITKPNTKIDDRWDVGPFVAPVYYNTLGEGSSIDAMFADNTQSGDVNLSYGVQVSYAITDKLSVRSGVSNVDLSYATGDVELGTGPVGAALKSIDYGGRQVVLTVVDKGTLAEGMNDGDPFGNITPKSTAGDVSLIQNINYYEVPLELKYALLNNKIGVNVIGGFSTLFLGSNDVSVRAADFSETLGEANNLSSVSFTTNIGLGLDYKISRKFKFNIEPMFKYQLNPYTDSSVGFKPYYLGVYTGLSFKF